MSFRIKKGGKMALVGINGAGKSTIVKLLCGFYMPDEGHIYINGTDLATMILMRGTGHLQQSFRMHLHIRFPLRTM